VLFLLDTTEPQTPTREVTQQVEETISSKSALDTQDSSPQRARDSPDMENLKRKLSSTRRPETASRNLLPELNQYKQNNVALQKQIESLMAKLNESKQSERALRTSLDDLERQCNEWQARAEEAAKAVKSAQALQNTIDHLESRLEIANIERLDAEEQLFNVQTQKSPFDSDSKFQASSPGSQEHVKVC
jgi:predicted  nucleic acid-binding Zn-ribbon protein